VERDVFMGSFMINFGKQIVYDNTFLVDYSIGFGYGFANESNFSDRNVSTYDRGNHYGFLGAADGVPLAFSFRLKIGFVY